MRTKYVAVHRATSKSKSALKKGSSHRSFGAWVIVCVMVASVITGTLVQLRSLQRENASLRQQLASTSASAKFYATQAARTCFVEGDWSSNQTKEVTASVKGTPRSYLIHTPAGFDKSKYYPLVLFYVGRGGGANGAGVTYGLNNLPAIVAYPSPTVGDQNMTAWEGAPYSSNADDIAFTSAILDDMQSKLCIDRTHVYAAGLSNGGGFAALLSCHMSDRLAAIAVESGAMYPPEQSCKPARPVPMIVTHGDQDPTVPYYGSVLRHLAPVEKWTAMRAALNNCSDPTTTYPGSDITLTEWNKCQHGAEVESYRIVGGGHGWGAISNQSIWRFLSQFSI
ncbi:MAG TPA: PHB depolymerase family esterase [Candidatus Bathyarchaeia archaeon]|nr:PHB depolymerase family esterase [Candidatus Bathyarchaeia archaeon]